MMSDINLGPVDSTPENAKAIVSLSNFDLLEAGLSSEDALEIVDPSNPVHIERQIRRLREHRERYVGAFSLDRLVGILKTNEWTAGDQLPYATHLTERLSLRASTRLGNHLSGRPLGIHSLVVRQGIDWQSAVTAALVDAAVERANGGELRIGMYDSDPAKPFLVERDFVSTGKHGDILGVRNELYIRHGSPPRQ